VPLTSFSKHVCQARFKQSFSFCIVCGEKEMAMPLWRANRTQHTENPHLPHYIQTVVIAFYIVCRGRGRWQLLEPSIHPAAAHSHLPHYIQTVLSVLHSLQGRGNGNAIMACYSNLAHREPCTTLSCCCSSSSAPLHPNSS